MTDSMLYPSFSMLRVYRLKGAKEELAQVMAQLKEKQDKLASIEAKVCSAIKLCEITISFILLNTSVSMSFIAKSSVSGVLDCRSAGQL